MKLGRESAMTALSGIRRHAKKGKSVLTVVRLDSSFPENVTNLIGLIPLTKMAAVPLAVITKVKEAIGVMKATTKDGQAAPILATVKIDGLMNAKMAADESTKPERTQMSGWIESRLGKIGNKVVMRRMDVASKTTASTSPEGLRMATVATGGPMNAGMSVCL